MTDLRVIVMSAEEGFDGIAEFWYGDEMMGMTIVDEGRLHLRIDARADGQPWLIDTTSLARALTDASTQLAAY
jgi:hypothetical protein